MALALVLLLPKVMTFVHYYVS